MKGSNRMVPFWEMRTDLLTMLGSLGRLDWVGCPRGRGKKTERRREEGRAEDLCGHGGEGRRGGEGWGKRRGGEEERREGRLITALALAFAL